MNDRLFGGNRCGLLISCGLVGSYTLAWEALALALLMLAVHERPVVVSGASDLAVDPIGVKEVLPKPHPDSMMAERNLL